MSSDQGWFETDEDYAQRIAEEANERTIEELTGDAPNQGFFESDEAYRDRMAEEANEARIENLSGEAPTPGWFESETDYRDRIHLEANERTVETIGGSAPSQGFFASDEAYDVRVRLEANELLIQQSTGEGARQGWIEGDHAYRSRVAHEARLAAVKNARGDGATTVGHAEPSSSYEVSDGSAYGSPSSSAGSGGLWLLGLLLLLGFVVVNLLDLTSPRIAVRNAVEISPSTSVPLLSEEPPSEIVDRGACPFEMCQYGERWLARVDVTAFETPPDTIGADVSSLKSVAIVRSGTWVTTQTGLVIARRLDGRVNEHTSYGANDRNSGPPLRRGQVIAAYSYLGEGCHTSWNAGRFYAICGLETGRGSQEWWVQIEMPAGLKGWVSVTDSFISEDALNTELAHTIQDSAAPPHEKLAKIDGLIRSGASLNGDGGRYGMRPSEAAVKANDVPLLDMLLARGLDLRKSCVAEHASQSSLEPGGDVLLEALLAGGMPLDCLTRPPLHAFLLSGISGDSYPVDRATNVARLLIQNGARIDQRDSSGESILEVLADARWSDRVTALRQAIVEVGAASKVPGTGPSPVADDRYRPGALVTNPQVLFEKKPAYTQEAMRAQIQGSVEIEGVVMPDGTLANPHIVRSLDRIHGLDQSALAAVTQWRFKPGRLRSTDEPVPVIVSIELTFTLR